MKEKLMRAKHWQLFTLTFGLPMLFQIILMISIFSDLADNREPNAASMITIFSILAFFMVIFASVYYGWIWSVATGFQSEIPKYIRMNITLFKLFFFFPLVYLLLFVIIFILLIGTISVPGPRTDPGIIPSFLPLVFIFHIFSMFCIFYTFYFTAKTIKTAELQRDVNFSEFAGEFFMIWFYPIGIWILQPKINKLVKSTLKQHDEPTI